MIDIDKYKDLKHSVLINIIEEESFDLNLKILELNAQLIKIGIIWQKIIKTNCKVEEYHLILIKL